MPFTFLHWKLAENLVAGKIRFEQVDDFQIKQLLYNIFPNGETILHMLCKKGSLMEKMITSAHTNPMDKSECDFDVPFNCNFDKKTPIHICAENNDYKTINMLLEYLTAYGIDHHSRAIIDQMPGIVEHELPALMSYFDSRMIQTILSK